MQASLELLQKGKVVLVPTDTVYGLAAFPTQEACTEISHIKGRSECQPIAWLISHDLLDILACDLPEYAKVFARRFWPGPLTLVVNASQEARKYGSLAQNNTLALRCPDNQFCLDLIRASGKPLACTSANKHRQPAPYLLEQIDKEFLAYAADELPKRCKGNCASTILDCTGRLPVILRKGYIQKEDFEKAYAFDATLT